VEALHDDDGAAIDSTCRAEADLPGARHSRRKIACPNEFEALGMMVVQVSNGVRSTFPRETPEGLSRRRARVPPAPARE
jgi:hypothetical protein